MNRNLQVLLLVVGLFSVTARVDNRNKGIQLPTTAKMTPCAPGVVYVKLKAGSSIGIASGPKGNVTLSIGPSSAFAKVTGTLGLRETVPFDAHASKDSISRSFGIDRMYCLYYSNRTIDPHDALAMLLTTGEVECGSVRYLFAVSKQTNDSLLNELCSSCFTPAVRMNDR